MSDDLRKRATELEAQIEELTATVEAHKTAAAAAYEQGDTAGAEKLIGKVGEATARTEAMTAALSSLRERIREADRAAAEARRREQAEKTVDEAIEHAKKIRPLYKRFLEDWNNLLSVRANGRSRDLPFADGLTAAIFAVENHSNLFRDPDPNMPGWPKWPTASQIDVDEQLKRFDAAIANRDELIRTELVRGAADTVTPVGAEPLAETRKRGPLIPRVTPETRFEEVS